jgi:hypothetical protein
VIVPGSGKYIEVKIIVEKFYIMGQTSSDAIVSQPMMVIDMQSRPVK